MRQRRFSRGFLAGPWSCVHGYSRDERIGVLSNSPLRLRPLLVDRAGAASARLARVRVQRRLRKSRLTNPTNTSAELGRLFASPRWRSRLDNNAGY